MKKRILALAAASVLTLGAVAPTFAAVSAYDEVSIATDKAVTEAASWVANKTLKSYSLSKIDFGSGSLDKDQAMDGNDISSLQSNVLTKMAKKISGDQVKNIITRDWTGTLPSDGKVKVEDGNFVEDAATYVAHYNGAAWGVQLVKNGDEKVEFELSSLSPIAFVATTIDADKAPNISKLGLNSESKSGISGGSSSASNAAVAGASVAATTSNVAKLAGYAELSATDKASLVSFVNGNYANWDYIVAGDVTGTAGETITFTVGSQYAGRTAHILHLTNGAWGNDTVTTKVASNGTVARSFSSFSPVAIVVEKTAAAPYSPKTGDTNALYVLLAMAAVAGTAVVATKKSR